VKVPPETNSVTAANINRVATSTNAGLNSTVLIFRRILHGQVAISHNSNAYAFLGYQAYADNDSRDAEFGIVKEVKIKDEDIKIDFEATTGAINDITYDNEKQALILIKDGEFIEVEDLEDDDVLFAIDVVEDGKAEYKGAVAKAEGAYEAYLVVSPVAGEVEKLYQTNAQIKFGASGRFSYDHDLDGDKDALTITEDTVIGAVYTEEDCDEHPSTGDCYAWECFDKVELIAVEDILGGEIEADYVDVILDGREVEYIFLVNPEDVPTKGDIQMATLVEHFKGNFIEYLIGMEDEEIAIEESAGDAGDFDSITQADLEDYPVVVLYCLADDGEYTYVDTLLGDDATAVDRGEMIKLFDANGVDADNLETLIQKYYDDDDYAVLVEEADEYAENLEDIVFEDETTIYFGDVEVIDLTDGGATMSAEDAVELCVENEGEYELVVIYYKDTVEDQAVAAWLIKQGI